MKKKAIFPNKLILSSCHNNHKKRSNQLGFVSFGNKIHLNIFHLILIILISSFAGYYLGVNKIKLDWKGYSPILEIKAKNPPVGQNLDMSLFYQVLDRINKDYYDKSKINSRDVLYGAITGMLQSLGDPYTTFFPPKENNSFKSQLSGKFEGIGAELGVSDQNRIIVISPLDSSPAQKSGIRSGDTILKIDDKDTFGMNLPQAVEKIRGPKGTTVKLNILHENSRNPVDIPIVRDVILVKSVTSWVKPVSCDNSYCFEDVNCPSCDSVAYIRLSQFGDRTNDEWTTAVNFLTTQNIQSPSVKGIILDVRNNPGGYLNDAVFIASEFLRDGVVAKQSDNAGSEKQLRVSRKGIFLDKPLIVLINKGSASASEIVAGALSDNNRATLMGEKSFGKGTIQEAVEVGNGASVHISVAKWLTPNGTWVDKKGLSPDIEVKFDEKIGTQAGQLDNQIQSAIRELTK